MSSAEELDELEAPPTGIVGLVCDVLVHLTADAKARCSQALIRDDDAAAAYAGAVADAAIAVRHAILDVRRAAALRP